MAVTKKSSQITNLVNLHIYPSHSGTIVFKEIQTEETLGNGGSIENQHTHDVLRSVISIAITFVIQTGSNDTRYLGITGHLIGAN
jgi:hypothetical protein